MHNNKIRLFHKTGKAMVSAKRTVAWISVALVLQVGTAPLANARNGGRVGWNLLDAIKKDKPPMIDKHVTSKHLENKYVTDTAVSASLPGQDLALKWSELPMLPNNTGVAGAFVGVCDASLILAGGANFPGGGAPWKGSKKVWYDTIYVLNDLESRWQIAGQLPRPLGYGVTIHWKDHMILVGGSNEQGHYPDVWQLSYTNGKLRIDSLSPLPVALANAAGALVGDCIYIAGGLLAPDDLSSSMQCWRLDLSAAKPIWEQLPSWPGASRMLSVAGSIGGKFYLFSGTELIAGKRIYLKDAFCYNPQVKDGKEAGWHRLATLPHSVVAAPGPALSKSGKLYVFGGDDGALANQAATLKDRHPGFSDDILSYDPKLDQWSLAGKCWTDKKTDAVGNPNGSIWAPVTTGLTVWKGAVILAGGEVRPSTRTPRVLMGVPR